LLTPSCCALTLAIMAAVVRHVAGRARRGRALARALLLIMPSSELGGGCVWPPMRYRALLLSDSWADPF